MKNYSFIKPDPTLHSNLMAFGYDCDKGWYSLIEELFDKIQILLDTKYQYLKEDFEILQVKEKWGILRVYVSVATDEIFNLIDEYEEKSSHICEVCGKLGELDTNRNWYMTLCENCKSEKRN